jgi:hypothetical protein
MCNEDRQNVPGNRASRGEREQENGLEEEREVVLVERGNGVG